MASSGSNPVDVFDVRKIRRLVELMDDHDLSEIDLRQGEQRIRLRKGREPVVIAGAPNVSAPVVQPTAPTVDQPQPPPTTSPSGEDASYITSPMVGTFHASPSPEAAPFVKVGDRVGPETITCVIEAMKVFNEIQASCSGAIAAVLVESGEPVEFGQKLFKVIKET